MATALPPPDGASPACRRPVGRHGGCRLLLERDTDALLVGTGDAAVGTNPRDLDSLGGKVLRVHRRTGEPMADNPFADAGTARRFVLTYGHRNVQGLAQRADGSLWSVEHGSYRDDEVNLLVPGGDYGWNPVPGLRRVGADDRPVPPRRAAGGGVVVGHPTLATSGAAWVGVLKGVGWDTSDVMVMKLWEGGLVSVTAFAGGTVLAYGHVFLFSGSLLEPVLKGWAVLCSSLTPSVDALELATLAFFSVVPYMAAIVVPVWRTASADPDAVMR